ncbi:MAG: hypothetical protein F4X56_04215 [Gammaproteobacteria bacterium]|nr:hypothetical protein [Gammaproteobacteria bacterium]
MSAFVKDRLYISLGIGVFVGGLLAAIACIFWSNFGHDSSDRTSEYRTQPADEIRPQLVLSGSEDFNELDDSVSNFELTASLRSLLVTKGETDLLHLLNQNANTKSKIVRQTVSSLVFERLVDLDPNMALKHALDLQGQQQIDSLQTVFREWALLDMDAAIAAGKSLDHLFATVALRSVVLARNDLSETMRHDIEHHLGDDNFIQTVIAEEPIWLQTQNPEEAWRMAIGDGKQLTDKVGLLASIAEVWWRQDSEGVLQKMVEATEPTSDQWNSETHVALRVLVQALTEHSPQEVFEQAVSLSEPFREALVRAVSEHWSQFDPRAAFIAASAHESDVRRKILTRIVAEIWARSNPYELIDFTSSLLAKPSREIAMEEAILSLGRSNRDEAIELLQDAHGKGFVAMNSLDTFFSDWTKEDRHAAIHWILSDQDLKEHERKGILRVILETIEIDDAQDRARAWATLSRRWHQSVEEHESELVGLLAKTDIESAISLLPNLRRESKLASISGVGRILVSSDQPNRALKLADLLMEDQRSDYYSSIFLQWSGNNYKHLLKTIESLPTKKI